MVVPMRERWELFAKRFPAPTADLVCLERFWLESVLPVMLAEWSLPSVGMNVGPELEVLLPDLDFAFPRGVLVSCSGGEGRCEVWHSGGLADWMEISSRSIEAAFARAQDWRWVRTHALVCLPEKGEQAVRLLGLSRRWWSETGARKR